MWPGQMIGMVAWQEAVRRHVLDSHGDFQAWHYEGGLPFRFPCMAACNDDFCSGAAAAEVRPGPHTVREPARPEPWPASVLQPPVPCSEGALLECPSMVGYHSNAQRGL